MSCVRDFYVRLSLQGPVNGIPALFLKSVWVRRLIEKKALDLRQANNDVK